MPKSAAPTRSRTKRPAPGLLFDREKLKDYPVQPGVYFMKSQAGEILYIGKAKNLRHRLRSYFQKQSRLPTKIAAMMKQVVEIEVTVVGSELEALLLEARLIKTHLPFFNKKIKDYKSMVFLKVSLHNDFPRISEVSDTDDPTAAYFGPFAGKAILRYKLEILNRVFKLRDCSEKTFAQHQHHHSPCMQYQLGFCSGPCAERISPEAYQESVADFLRYLEQQPSHAVEHLISKRDAYIETLQFEKAAALHQQWELMERLQLQNYSLRRALAEHHCLIVLPDTQPAFRRILTVIHGQPVHWDSVLFPANHEPPAATDPLDAGTTDPGTARNAAQLSRELMTTLASIIQRANTAMAAPREEVNPAFNFPGGSIAKAMHEEARLISRWLTHHTPSEGAVVFLKNKDETQLLAELQTSLQFPQEAEISPAGLPGGAPTAVGDANGFNAPYLELPDFETSHFESLNFETPDEAWLWEQALEMADPDSP